jgi:hypothetical protein
MCQVRACSKPAVCDGRLLLRTRKVHPALEVGIRCDTIRSSTLASYVLVNAGCCFSDLHVVRPALVNPDVLHIYQAC